jgi:hypothetical protein
VIVCPVDISRSSPPKQLLVHDPNIPSEIRPFWNQIILPQP